MNTANQPTPAFLVEAGLRPGMRVLDLGCHAGDLSRLAARLVGPEGAVIGVDRNEAALTQGRAVPPEPGAAPIRYEMVDLATPDRLAPLAAPPFDAIVIRRVLMYLANPAALLASLPPLLRQGGLLAIQEHDSTGMPIAAKPVPLHRKVHRWVWGTVAAEGDDPHFGLALPGMLTRAGLTIDFWRAEAILVAADAPSHLGHGVRGMLPRMVAGGVVTEDMIGIDTLDERLEAERREAGAALVWDMAHLIVARSAA